MASINHKLINEGAIESRLYQESILNTASNKNTLVVLPTGLGKTFIAALVAAKKLEEAPLSRVLFLAPTRPLVEQHCSTWKKVFNFDKDFFKVFTGTMLPNKRRLEYDGATFLFATPQVIQNDLIARRISLEDVSLLIVDEAHRATGAYPYGFIAKKYVNEATKPRILALTASPGSYKEQVDSVCKELFIETVEARDRFDGDVSPYVKEKSYDWIKVSLPDDFVKIKTRFEGILKDRLDLLKRGGIIGSAGVGRIRKKQLLDLQGKLALIASQDPAAYKYMSAVASAFKLYHCIELLETQGIAPLSDYLKKLEKDSTKAAKELLNDHRFGSARLLVSDLEKSGIEHPKLNKVVSILKEYKRAIVFAHYRSSVNNIFKALKKEKIKAVKLIGQANGGLTQKEQVKNIKDFENGKYQVLIATSVGEEGLDIPAVDNVVFYEPVPSAIRSIQRGGRTARMRPGKVTILVTSGTRDEAYYWSAYHKERKMREVIKNMGAVKAQHTLDKFSGQENVVIFADNRESGSGVLRELSNLGAEVRLKQLGVADFQLSSRVGVERKTTNDFLQSLIDGRLMSQSRNLVGVFERPLIIIEGKSLYGIRNVHPNAIRGSLASLVIDYGIPIVFSEDYKETAALLAVIARREQFGRQEEIQLRSGRKPVSLNDMQQFIVESLPKVGPTLAKKLLKEFKTVEKVITASEGDLQKIPKLGEKKAKEIRKVIKARYKGD